MMIFERFFPFRWDISHQFFQSEKFSPKTLLKLKTKTWGCRTDRPNFFTTQLTWTTGGLVPGVTLMSGTFNRLCHIDPKPVPWVMKHQQVTKWWLGFFCLFVLVLLILCVFCGGKGWNVEICVSIFWQEHHGRDSNCPYEKSQPFGWINWGSDVH